MRETDAPGDDPFAELTLEVLPGPEVLEPEPEVLEPEPEVLSEPEPDVLEEEPKPDVLRAPLTLQRLLDRAKPSLAEAASLAALVLDALGVMHETGGAHGRLDSRSIRLTSAGTVRIAGRRHGGKNTGGAERDERRADIQAAAAIVAEIDKAAGRPNRPLTDREERLTARLAANTDQRSLSRRGLRKAARGLEMAVGGADQREAARQGVTGLVRAVAGYDAAAVAGSGVSGEAANGHGAPLARRLPPPARRAPMWPKIWKPLAIAAALIIIVGGWLHFFGGTVQRNVATLLGGNAQAASGPNGPAPLPDLGPPASGPITHLEVRPLDGCRPESACNAVVQVAVVPQSTAREVTWNFELFDRCGALHESWPNAVLTVPPDHDRAVQTVAVAVPAGRALTLVPVATAPARVAGTPMPLFPANRPC